MQEKSKKLIYQLSYYFVLGLIPVLCAWIMYERSGAAMLGMVFAFFSFFVLYFLKKTGLVKKSIFFFAGYSAFFLVFSFLLDDLFYDLFGMFHFFEKTVLFSWYACLVWLFVYVIYSIGRFLLSEGQVKK